MRGSWLIAGAAALLACSLVLFLVFDDRLEGDGAEPSGARSTIEEPIPVEPDAGIGDGAGPPGGEGPGGPGERAEDPPAPDPEALAARGARRAYRSYIAAIDDRRGTALCRLVAGDPARAVEAPVERGGCSSTLRASIGYEDPRGFPVWETTRLSGIDRVAVAASNRRARITATTVTEFRDRTQPSIESDIAYLERRDGRWLLLKPTGILYRAVGSLPPPDVIAPPPGFEL